MNKLIQLVQHRAFLPLFLLVVWISLNPPSAHAQTSYPTQCVSASLDAEGETETTLCISGDTSLIDPYMEVDDNTQYYEGDVVYVDAQAQMVDSAGDTSAYLGYAQSCCYSYNGTAELMTSVDTTIGDTYTLTGDSGECLDPTEGDQPYNCTYYDMGSLSVSLSTTPPPYTGYLNPKYVVVGVTYAPPGSSSSVTYTNTTSVGSTTALSQSFSSALDYSLSVSHGFGVPAAVASGGGGGAGSATGVTLTYTSTSDYTQGSNSSTTTTLTKASTIAYSTAGTPTFSPVNSDYDYIWLWINPVLVMNITPAAGSSPASVVFTGYAMDPNDPITGFPPTSGAYTSGPDIVEVQVGCLNGDFSCPSDLVLTSGVVTSGVLARSWAASLYDWPSGDGPGLTSTDIANILTFDPLIPSNSYTLLGSYPSTTSDGRFTKEPYPPNPIQYPIGAGTETYNTVQTNTQSVAQGASTSIKQSFGLSEKFSSSFLGLFQSTTTMSQTQTLTWNYSWLDTLTTTNTLTDALSVKGPPDPPPPYSGPAEFILYQDNMFGTFAFVPGP